MVLAAFVWAENAALVRAIGDGLPTAVIVFFRNAIATVVLLPLILRAGPRSVLTVRRPGLQALRIVMGLSAMACTFYAYRHMNIADATALSFLGPLFTMLLAVVILREVPGWRRWAAAAVGFVGMLIMIRPGFAVIDGPVLIALFGAFLIGGVGITLKALSRSEAPLTMIVLFVLAATLLSLPFAVVEWVTPDPIQLLLLVILGSTAVLGHLADIRAYHNGEATVVAPFRYSLLIWAGLIGFLAFGEIPDHWKVIGAGIVATANIYIARREAIRGRFPPSDTIKS